MWSIPNCVGCIGGKYVIVKCPSNFGSNSFQGTLYIVLLAMVDCDYNFTFIDIGSYGSIDDSGIFANSSLMRAIEQNQINIPEDAIILGDLTLPSQLSSMKPYPEQSNMNDTHEIDNSRHSHAKLFIENSFDILTTRFQVLRKPINLRPTTVVKLTKATCALHNWIRKSTNKVMTTDSGDHEFSSRIIPEANDNTQYQNCVPESREKSSKNFIKEGAGSWLVSSW